MKKYQIEIEKDENGMYIGEVIGLPACYTQASSIPELLNRLVEVSEGSLELLRELSSQKTTFKVSLNVEYAKA
ncbi:MAG TPA: type II toxin-antitoxin system HicB family antitoxin [Candidatus Absconditabacterales bacterium]|nr:type II toxin-antitoxin system HicB family antitoxin [Candidatus Absconditabacterales bacterium]HMT27213.1 type II toxin-antitoxin system HicB family antitoxin [Candidatus Absconditabacterales bacterium]